MILFTRQVRFAGIRYLYKVVWKVRKKKLQQETTCQVLQAFLWMRNIPVLWYIAFEEVFRLFYLPYTKTGIFVNCLLKKNRHKTNLRFKIAE